MTGSFSTTPRIAFRINPSYTSLHNIKLKKDDSFSGIAILVYDEQLHDRKDEVNLCISFVEFHGNIHILRSMNCPS